MRLGFRKRLLVTGVHVDAAANSSCKIPYIFMIFFYLSSFWFLIWWHGLCTTKTHTKRVGIRAKVTCLGPKNAHLLCFFLSNVQSQKSKMDEIYLRLTQQREIRDCCAHIFTETCLTPHILDEAIALNGRGLFRTGRTQDSGKQRGGVLCVYINNSWCSNTVKVDGQGSPDVKFLKKPQTKTPALKDQMNLMLCSADWFYLHHIYQRGLQVGLVSLHPKATRMSEYGFIVNHWPESISANREYVKMQPNIAT